MRKLIFLLIVLPLFLSCEKEVEKGFIYTDAQKHARNVLNGRFTDTSIYSTGYGADVIDFYNVYTNPILEYYSDNTIKDIIFGECSYYDAFLKTTSNYYYYIYDNGSSISLSYKGGENDKKLYGVFSLILIDEKSFYMKDDDLSLPYKFVKQ